MGSGHMTRYPTHHMTRMLALGESLYPWHSLDDRDIRDDGGDGGGGEDDRDNLEDIDENPSVEFRVTT